METGRHYIDIHRYTSCAEAGQIVSGEMVGWERAD